MRSCFDFLPILAIGFFGSTLACPGPVQAQGQDAAGPRLSITLEIFSDGQLQPAMAQDWARTLNGLKFRSVQVRSGDSSDQLDILDLGEGHYKVYAMLTSGNELLLPGNYRVPRGRVREIYPYLEKMIAESRAAGAAASVQQVPTEAMFRALAVPVGVSTLDQSRGAVLQQIVRSLEMEVRIPRSINAVLTPDDRVTEDLSGLSRGTALQYLLRYVGYCACPEPLPDRSGYRLTVVEAAEVGDRPVLPIGYEVEDAGQVAVLYEKFNANVNGVNAEKILETLSGRLQIPFLYDYNSLAGAGVELDAVTIKQNPGKFTYNQLIDIVLYQSKLRKEVRMDESGGVFLWITTLKPVL